MEEKYTGETSLKEQYGKNILLSKEYVDSKDKETEQLSKKCEILEENNKLLIQQKQQMYEDLDRYSNIIEELEEFLTKVIETGAGIEQITCKNIKNYIQELKERK